MSEVDGYIQMAKSGSHPEHRIANALVAIAILLQQFWEDESGG